MIDYYTENNFTFYCDQLAARDKRLKQIIVDYGYPPFWHREPGYASLVRIILEQQVSLASAFACFQKLKAKIGDITPKNVLAISESALKECGLSRQKILYVRNLAYVLNNNEVLLNTLVTKKSEEIRQELIAIKGIGNWTIDVYLLNCLHKLDIFPVGDLVLVKSLRSAGFIGTNDSKEAILEKTARFHPLRSILSILLWYQYIKENGIDDTLLE